MAKFAELTDLYEGRVLINPDTVVSFGRAPDVHGLPAPATRLVTAWTSIVVQEPPDEVLRRLCSPVMPDDAALETGNVSEIVDSIERFRRWSEKHDEAKTPDTPASNDELTLAWELLDDIADRLKALL